MRATAAERIAVIGTSGAGKTTLARRLAGQLDAPHLELDSIFHQAGWEALPTDEFRRRVEGFCASDRWVTCGKYAVVRDLIFARADTIVCLDHNRLRQTLRVYWRSVRRVLGRQVLWNGNREPLVALWPFGPPEEVVARWVWEKVPRTRRLFDDLESHPPHEGVSVVRLRGWRQIERFARSVPEGAPTDRQP